MPASSSEIFNALNEGTSDELRSLLERKGVKWPKDPALHPVFDLLALAHRRNPPQELPGKLEVLLDFGTPVDFKLPHRHKAPRSRQRTLGIGIPERFGRDEDNLLREHSTLVARAAGIGRSDLVDVLLDRGASLRMTGVGSRETYYPLLFAADGGHMDTLLHLVETLGPDAFERPSDWSVWAKTALYKMPRQRRDILDVVINTCPNLDTPQARQAAMSVLRNTGAGQGNIQWLERDPSLWSQLHDVPFFDDEEEKISCTLWPVVLKDAIKRGTRTPLFRIALGHESKAGRLNNAVLKGHVMSWGVVQDGRDQEHQLGWKVDTIGLPPLQVLLHATSKIRNAAEYRRVLRVASKLMEAGAILWTGAQAHEAPVTEAMLFEENRITLPKRWLDKHPDFLLPHPRTGKSALDVAKSIAGVQHWIDCGAVLDVRDRDGNQAFAGLVSRSCGGWAAPPRFYCAKAPEWAKWIERGWIEGTLPTDGEAYGRSIGEWACARNDLSTLWSRKTRRSLGDLASGLHVAAQHLNFTTVERILQEGADPGAIDKKGWSALSYLAAAAHRASSGHDENAFDKIQGLVDASKWPDYSHEHKADPWKILLSGNRAYKILFCEDQNSAATLFWSIHGRRMRNYARWTSEDSPLLLSHFTEPSKQKYFKKLVATLPQGMLDDMALSLFDPERWPEGQCDGILLGAAHLKCLVEAGADLGGCSIEGKRLSDTWRALQLHEQCLRDRGDEATRAAVTLMNTPEGRGAVAVAQAQQLEARSSTVQATQGLRRRL